MVEYPILGGWARGYLFPNPPVFMALLNRNIGGYAPRTTVVTATVYINYPDEVRWSGTTTAAFPFGFYQFNNVELQTGDWVEVELQDGTLLSSTVAELHDISYDTELDEVYGFAPTGETVRVTFRDVSDGFETYVETHAVASGGVFTADFTDADLRPSSGVGLFIADANGNETALSSGPPFIEAILDPRSDMDCVMGRVDAPNLPITLSIQTDSGTYTRTNPIGPSDAGNLMGYYCYLVWGPDWGPINFAPGDILTLQTPSWQGQLTIADLAWQADNANDLVTGSAPVGEVQVSRTQWHAERYPVNDYAAVRTLSDGAFSAAFSGFDLRGGGGNDNGVLHDVGILHYDPASDFVNHLEDYVRFIQAEPPWGVWGFTPLAHEPVTAWLYDESQNLLASSDQDGADDPYFFWFGDFQGYQLQPGYWITVTADSGWAAGLQIPEITLQADQATDMLWGEAPKGLLYLDGGREESGFGFFVPVDGYAYNTAWLGHDLQFGDDANAYYSALDGSRAHRYTRIGEVFRAEFWLEPNGSSSMWGEAMPGLEVRITTPRGQFIAEEDPSCPGCWYSETGLLYPGEEVTVEAGDGLLPVVITIPDPLTAEVDVDLEQVWGQIGGYTGTIQVHGQWQDGYQEVQTDDSGNYLATYDDIPRRAEGYVRFEDSVDVSYPVMVVYHRPFRDLLSLVIRANYAHEWVEGNYEAGHTIWITLTNSSGDIKATASGVTGEIPWWGGDNNGFSTGYNVFWYPWQPDLQVGDWVYAALDNGQATDLRIGEITGELDSAEDTVSGNIYAPWFSEPLWGDCSVWVENGVGQGFPEPIDPNGGSYFCDFGEMGWDLLPGHDVGVGYYEPDQDQVINVFREDVPELRVWTGGQGRPGAGGNTALWVGHQNSGAVPDTGAYISMTLQDGLTYLSDTSGLLHSGSGAPGDPLVWQLPSPLEPSPYQTWFEVFAHVDAAEGVTVTADAHIDSTMDYFQSDWGAKYSHWEDQVVAFEPDVSIGKWAWTGDPVPGSTFVYGISVCNNNEAGSLPVTLTDTLPISVTLQNWWGRHGGWEEVSFSDHELVLSRPSVPGWWCGDVYLRVLLDESAEPGMTIYNTATVATEGDTYPDNNTTTIEHGVGTPHDNLTISKDWVQGQFVPGGEIFYNFNFGNSGNLSVDNVVVTSTLPENTSFVRAWEWTPYGEVDYPPDVVTDDYLVWYAGALENGFWQNVNLILKIDDDAPVGSLLTHTVQINRLPLEDRYDDNQITWVDPLNDFGNNLWVNKQNYYWENEGRLWYEIRIANRGNTRLDDVWITDTYPEFTTLTDWWVNHGREITATENAGERQIAFWVDWLDPGETASIGFHLDVDGDLIGQQGLLFPNYVDAPLEGDVYPADNYDQVMARTGPDVFIEKELIAGEPKPGEQLTFHVRFGNSNLSPWDSDWGYVSHITETLPAGMTFITATAPWDPSQTWEPVSMVGNTVVWEWGAMGNGTLWEFDLVVQLDEDLPGGEVLTNRIEAYGDSPNDIDPLPENNVSELPVTVLAPLFEVSKTYESSGVAGMPVRYDLSLANTGTLPATDILLVDMLPAGITYAGSDGSFAAGQVSWEIASLDPSNSVAGWISGTLTCQADVEVINQDYGVTESTEGVTADGAAVSFTTLPPDIQASFQVSATALTPGEIVAFTAQASTDGTPLSYAWDFGDGETGSGVQVEHSYADPGSYTVELVVTDECGFTDSDTLTIVVAPHAIYMPLLQTLYNAGP
jgi:uncharacterized repeat protein (TIGR01451 family)